MDKNGTSRFACLFDELVGSLVRLLDARFINVRLKGKPKLLKTFTGHIIGRHVQMDFRYECGMVHGLIYTMKDSNPYKLVKGVD